MTFLGSPRGEPGRGGSESGLPELAFPAEVAQCPLHCNMPHRNLLPLAKGSGKQSSVYLFQIKKHAKGLACHAKVCVLWRMRYKACRGNRKARPSDF